MNDTPDPAPTTQPTTPDQLLARLTELGLKTRTVSHPPVFTVEEAKALRGDLPGPHIKNLFLRNKKAEMWLVVAEEDRPIDLKALGDPLGGRLSFGSPERLKPYLGVAPGAVTPFALIDDRDRQVKVALDKAHPRSGSRQLPSSVTNDRNDGDRVRGTSRPSSPPAATRPISGTCPEWRPRGMSRRGPAAPGRPETHLIPYLFLLVPRA